MSAPGGGKKEADAFMTSGLRRSTPTTPVSERPPAFPSLPAPLSRTGSSDSVALASSKRLHEEEESVAGALEKRIRGGTPFLSSREKFWKEHADVAYLRGRVDERSSIQRFLSDRDGGFSEALKSSMGEAIAERAPMSSDVAKSSRSAVVTVRCRSKDLPKAVNPTIFIKPAEGKRAVEDIRKVVLPQDLKFEGRWRWKDGA
ncbi:hypothetical protein J6590_083261 [Homalodisca vitripennis]|nr:hypothetical protein J6590_083261 [Homalodisca vitripennis]